MNLLTEALWRDEAFSVLLSKNDPLEIISLSAGDATPPLYYLLLHYWMALFGDSEVALRALSVLFWIGTAAVLYLIGRRQSLKAGFWLAALALSQPLLFRYALEVRAYSLFAFLTSIVIYTYLEKRYRLLFLSAAALLYTHLFGFWVIFILLAWAILRRENFWPFLLSILAAIPWIPNYLYVSRVSGGFLSPPDLEDLRFKLTLLGAPILLVLLPEFKRLISQPNFRLLAVLWLVPILGTFLVSQFRPIFLDRYLIFTIVAELLLVSFVFTSKYWRYLGPVILAAQVLISSQIFVGPNKPPYREMSQFIKANREVGDIVIAGTSLTYFESRYYGLNGRIYAPEGSDSIPYYVGRVLIPDEDILTKLPPAKRYWLINLDEGGGTLQQPFPARLVSEEQFGRLKLELYEPS